MKLQIGSSVVTGRYKHDDWVNLDIICHDGVDIVADASKSIPIADNTVELIHCVHVLEHVTRDKYKPMIAEMYRVLKPGGECYIETPDFEATVRRLHESFISGDVELIHKWTTSIYGKNEREGMAHHWGFYGSFLMEQMRKLEFKKIRRLSKDEEMISSHWKQEPVLLVRGTK